MARKKDPKKNVAPVHVDIHGQAGYDKYPNQWEIMNKRTRAKAPFASIEDRFAEWAMLDLKGEAFKLWYYMAKNKNDYRYALSPRAVGNVTGMSRNTYNRAKAELVEKGYLIHMHELSQCKDCVLFKECNHKACKDSYYFSLVSKYRIGEDKLKEYFKWCDETNEEDFYYGEGEDWDFICEEDNLDYDYQTRWFVYDTEVKPED